MAFDIHVVAAFQKILAVRALLVGDRDAVQLLPLPGDAGRIVGGDAAHPRRGDGRVVGVVIVADHSLLVRLHGGVDQRLGLGLRDQQLLGFHHASFQLRQGQDRRAGPGRQRRDDRVSSSGRDQEVPVVVGLAQSVQRVGDGLRRRIGRQAEDRHLLGAAGAVLDLDLVEQLLRSRQRGGRSGGEVLRHVLGLAVLLIGKSAFKGQDQRQKGFLLFGRGVQADINNDVLQGYSSFVNVMGGLLMAGTARLSSRS